jgi:hypothetical protein
MSDRRNLYRTAQPIEESRNGNLYNNDGESGSTSSEIESPDTLEESLRLLIERDNPMADEAEKALDRL